MSATARDVPVEGRSGRAVLVVPTTAEFDSRVHRIADGLRARGHDVIIAGRLGAGAAGAEGVTAGGVRILRLPVVRTVLVPRPIRGAARWIGRVAGRFLPTRLVRMPGVALDAAAQARVTVAAVGPAEVWHANGLLALPTALALRGRHGGRVIYDAGDLYMDARNLARLPGPFRPFVAAWERRLARSADALVTVNDGYAKILEARFGRPVAVVFNSPDASEASVDDGRPHPLRAAIAPPAGTGLVLYHGGLVRDRGVEQLLDAIAGVPDAILVLMGYGDLTELISVRASADPTSRIRLLPAVPPSEVLAWVGDADVAAMVIQPTSLNHQLTTPNKLFEAMAAGTPVLAADLPGMRAIVESTGCGQLVDPTSVDAIRAALTDMLGASAPQRAGWSAAGRAAISATYGWTRQLETLRGVYEAATGRPW